MSAHNYKNFIVLGDSFSEGMTDIQVNGKFVGWADRVADVMSAQTSGFRYANLAVRGKLIHQVVSDQVPAALKLIESDTLVSFHAGANDVIRPKYNPEIRSEEHTSELQSH